MGGNQGMPRRTSTTCREIDSTSIQTHFSLSIGDRLSYKFDRG